METAPFFRLTSRWTRLGVEIQGQVGEVVQAAIVNHRNDMNPNENGYNIDLSAHMAECDAGMRQRDEKAHAGVNRLLGEFLAFCLPGALYHDARCAEVIEYQCAKHFNAVYPYPNAGMRQRDEKAQVNRLLGEFLAFCLRHGVNAAREPLLAT